MEEFRGHLLKGQPEMSQCKNGNVWPFFSCIVSSKMINDLGVLQLTGNFVRIIKKSVFPLVFHGGQPCFSLKCHKVEISKKKLKLHIFQQELFQNLF